ncbi:MAG: hypothetical protein GX557_14875 [Chloroflexi bacterium]|nr:hypothetical protein [Chloroflexota bacterium]
MRNRTEGPGRIACLWVSAPPAPDLWGRALEALEAYSPAVEEAADAPAGGALAWLEARGVVPRHPSEAAWCEAILRDLRALQIDAPRLGVAATKFAAWLAAGSAPEQSAYQVVTQPDAAFLAPLPPHALPLNAETLRRLRLLGLHTIGQFAALPGTSVAEQFGAEHLRAHAWARGRDNRPVLGRHRQLVEAQTAFEVPEARSEALLEMAFRLSQRALQELPPPRAAWAIRWVTLECMLTSGESLKHTTYMGSRPGPDTLRTVLRVTLGMLRGKVAGVEELAVRLLGIEPETGKQLDLLTHAEAHQRLEEALQQLAKKHSADCIAWPALLDASAPLVAERYSLRAYAP